MDLNQQESIWRKNRYNVKVIMGLRLKDSCLITAYSIKAEKANL